MHYCQNTVIILPKELYVYDYSEFKTKKLYAASSSETNL